MIHYSGPKNFLDKHKNEINCYKKDPRILSNIIKKLQINLTNI